MTPMGDFRTEADLLAENAELKRQLQEWIVRAGEYADFNSQLNAQPPGTPEGMRVKCIKELQILRANGNEIRGCELEPLPKSVPEPNTQGVCKLCDHPEHIGRCKESAPNAQFSCACKGAPAEEERAPSLNEQIADREPAPQFTDRERLEFLLYKGANVYLSFGFHLVRNYEGELGKGNSGRDAIDAAMLSYGLKPEPVEEVTMEELVDLMNGRIAVSDISVILARVKPGVKVVG